MSQEAVERILGRMLTDSCFRARMSESPESASRLAGFLLTPRELRLLSGVELPCLAELSCRLDPGLCRASS